MKQYLLLILLINVAIFNSCTQKNQLEKTKTIASEKFDIWLNRQLKNAETEEFIHFSAICEHELSKKEIRKIKQTGLKINTLTGAIFTAQATKEQINQLAGLPFIKYIKGSKPVKPKNMN